ncbi:MAG: hypothetical protein A2X67_12525 [Ignavibacteria bacterium GWA2_55_11]|nr:MAG: hypothetical protein A2X67_12525 [Ignavibacteria bacterium GWA2_55_11]OGU61878.1 MAG: hypothetical protein A3C56_02470 [Ignavibacteria bacterium RIFCSPHIGHO2_02_FULL_56_12]OGU69651.1 MAG: hypothetical protein A3H45_02465 [Ignavibacteria bacterium RIFCSPLOWO2_02_FULL_55_14]OGU74081.1 MAG: hypothetical protein A3G43_05740 [Ignavibacteria bacterium RIFCSPLOWO2_12_FULL_56_21]
MRDACQVVLQFSSKFPSCLGVLGLLANLAFIFVERSYCANSTQGHKERAAKKRQNAQEMKRPRLTNRFLLRLPCLFAARFVKVKALKL